MPSHEKKVPNGRLALGCAVFSNQTEYECVCCGTLMFNSTTKFESGSGWPSFDQSIADDAVAEWPVLLHECDSAKKGPVRLELSRSLTAKALHARTNIDCLSIIACHRHNHGSNDIDAKPYIPIGCGDYEYIELACMDHYEVDVIKHDGTVRGLAVATETDDNGEYLIIQLDKDQRESIRVDQIKQIIVRSEPRRFDERTFEPLVDPSQRP